MGELESLGLISIRLNEFNDNEELRGLVKTIKEVLLKQYSKAPGCSTLDHAIQE